MKNIDLQLVLYIVAILFIIFILYILYKFILSISRSKRIESFSINNNDDFSIESAILKIIINISNFLKKLIVFNMIESHYDKYINKNSKLKDGMDVLTVKILLSLLCIIIYIFSISIEKQQFNIFIFLTTLIISFIIPDIYYYIKFRNHKNTVDDEILRSIIIMNNSFKANKSIEQSINDVINRLEGPIELEYRKVLYDTKLGLTISEAMMRMYDRTNINIIRDISLKLSLINKSGANIIDIFEQIEKDIIEERKLKIELNNIRKINSLFYIIFMLTPIIFIITLIIFNPNIFKIFTSKYCAILALIEIIIYTIYLNIIAKMIRRKY